MSRWKQFRYSLEELGCRLLATVVPKLSRPACLRLGAVLGALAYRLDARGRAVAAANLECVFGDRFSPAERERIARASYRNFVQTMLDIFWAQGLTPETHARWVKIQGFDRIMERMQAEKRGAVFLCTHQGNWEIGSVATGFMGLRNVTVVENFKNPRLTDIFQRMRQHSGHTIIPQENSLLRMLKTVKRGGSTAMLIDLNLRPSQAATIVEAFGPDGLEMCVPLLHAVLGQRGNAMLVPAETRPQPDGTVLCIAHEPLEVPAGASIQEIAQLCWDAYEPIFRARPEEWLWPYKHFRYRPRGATRAYPFYANESSKYEKLRRAAKATH